MTTTFVTLLRFCHSRIFNFDQQFFQTCVHFQIFNFREKSVKIGNLYFWFSLWTWSLTIGPFINYVRRIRVGFTQRLVYDRNHFFGLGPIPKSKPKNADIFGRYRNCYWSHISKGKSSYKYFFILKLSLNSNLLPNIHNFMIIFEDLCSISSF